MVIEPARALSYCAKQAEPEIVPRTVRTEQGRMALESKARAPLSGGEGGL